MFDRNSPIGVLDSGVGGFSVVQQIRRLMPEENILYFGDGANVPYGNHPEHEIVEMSRYMYRFMEEHGVKALMLACNTISCVADQCEDEVSCPTYNAVKAGAEAAVETAAELGIHKVGVISTVFTHDSGCYRRFILKRQPEGLEVLSHGCPNLARLVEHHLGDPVGMKTLAHDLRQEMDGLVHEDGIGCCVLGCTHYSLVQDTIRELYPDLPLIDPAEQMALALRRDLLARNLNRTDAGAGQLDVYTTGDVEEYRLRVKQTGLEPVHSICEYPPMKF